MLDRKSHLQLLRTQAVFGNDAGKRPGFGKKVSQIGIHHLLILARAASQCSARRIARVTVVSRVAIYRSRIVKASPHLSALDMLARRKKWRIRYARTYAGVADCSDIDWRFRRRKLEGDRRSNHPLLSCYGCAGPAWVNPASDHGIHYGSVPAIPGIPSNLC